MTHIPYTAHELLYTTRLIHIVIIDVINIIYYMCTYRCANPVVLYVSGGNTQVIANSNSIYTILFYIYFIYIQPYVVI